MAYTKTVWADEVPSATPVKYVVTDVGAGKSTIVIDTPVTPGTPMNAANFNHMEAGIKDAHDDIANMLNRVYPVGSVYTSIVSTNPATLFGGTWVAFGAGKVLVGFNAAETEFDTVEEIGGEKTHALVKTEMPAHSHRMRKRGAGTGTTYNALNELIYPNVVSAANTASLSFYTASPVAVEGGADDGGTYGATTGNGVAHNNLQPYIVVYFFKRTV